MKYKKIVSQMRNEIMTGKLSGTMPSMRNLTERFQVSHLTILHVFQELCAEGLIVGGIKKNYVIRDVIRRDNLILCLLRPPKEINFQDNFTTEMCTGVIRSAETNHMNVLFPHQNAGVLYQNSDDAFLQQMCAEMRPLFPYIRGIIAAASITDEQLAEYILPFADGKPVVLLNRDSSMENIGKTVFPTEQGCEELAQLILRQHCKHFILCQTHLTTDRRNDHTRLMKKFLTDGGIPDSQIVLMEGIGRDAEDPVRFRRIAEEIKSASGETLVFVSASTMACYTANALKAAGLTAGKDYKLCSFDGKISAEMHDPKITSIQISGDELGQKAVELLLSENPFRRVYVNSKLLLRDTL